MAKTLEDLLGQGAELQGDSLVINYHSLLEILNISPQFAPPNPSSETLAATLLMALNITTRYPIDDDGFDVTDNTQAIVSPSSEPRRSFVARDGESQQLTRLSFEIYSTDYGVFDPEIVIGQGNSDSNPPFQQ